MNTCSTCRWFREGDPAAKRLSARWPKCALTDAPVTSTMLACAPWKSTHDPSPEIRKIVEQIQAAKGDQEDDLATIVHEVVEDIKKGDDVQGIAVIMG